jgi:hypothetical protein
MTTTFGPKMVAISARNTKVYKICEICKAIFSSFYNISQPNFAILLVLVNYALSSCGDLLASPCLVLKLLYNGIVYSALLILNLEVILKLSQLCCYLINIH